MTSKPKLFLPPTESGYYWVASTPDDPLDWQIAFWDQPNSMLYTWCGDLLGLQGITEPTHRYVSRWSYRPDAKSVHAWRDLDSYGSWSGPEEWVKLNDPMEAPRG